MPPAPSGLPTLWRGPDTTSSRDIEIWKRGRATWRGILRVVVKTSDRGNAEHDKTRRATARRTRRRHRKKCRVMECRDTSRISVRIRPASIRTLPCGSLTARSSAATDVGVSDSRNAFTTAKRTSHASSTRALTSALTAAAPPIAPRISALSARASTTLRWIAASISGTAVSPKAATASLTDLRSAAASPARAVRSAAAPQRRPCAPRPTSRFRGQRNPAPNPGSVDMRFGS